MASLSKVLIIALGLAGSNLAGADTLLVNNVVPDAAGEGPGRGITMATVESRWGAPTARSPAVGQPPITRWDYPDFIVYFEYNHVIHSVRREPTQG